MSAGMDALDRGLVQVGQEAAEALARVAELEERAEADHHAIRFLFATMAEATEILAGRDGTDPRYAAAAEVQARRRAMHVVGGAR